MSSGRAYTLAPSRRAMLIPYFALAILSSLASAAPSLATRE